MNYILLITIILATISVIIALVIMTVIHPEILLVI